MSINTVFKIIILMISLSQITSCAISRAHQKNALQVGEVTPLSARVAKKITEPIKQEQSPKKMLEVGAGSGALTHKIISKMTEKDHLDLIEIEPILCDELRYKFGHLKNVSVQCMDFLDWHPSYQYDSIISTLPFNSFPADVVQKFIAHLTELAKDGAYLAFVEFKWLSGLRLAFMQKEKKEAYLKTRKVIMDFYEKYGKYYTNVYLNFPPLIIYHLVIDKSKTPVPAA